MSHFREICRTHGTIKSQCRCTGNRTTTYATCGEWCSQYDTHKADFTHDELALIRAACLTACPMFPNVPMYEPWASVFEKAGKAMQAMSDDAAWRAIHGNCERFVGCLAPDHVEPCK